MYLVSQKRGLYNNAATFIRVTSLSRLKYLCKNRLFVIYMYALHLKY